MARLTSRVSACHVLRSQHFYNVLRKGLTLTAIHKTKTVNPGLRADCNSGESCDACRHAKQSRMKRDASWKIK